jgi:hypothetical protein
LMVTLGTCTHRYRCTAGKGQWSFFGKVGSSEPFVQLWTHEVRFLYTARDNYLVGGRIRAREGGRLLLWLTGRVVHGL